MATQLYRPATATPSAERVIQKHRAYFEREAEDFDAIRKDPERVADPIRKFVYKHFLRLHKEDKRLAATLKIARRHHADWSGRKILEIGCGHGAYALAFAEMGAHVTMVDFSERMLEIAQRNFRNAGLCDRARFVYSDLRELDLDETYDLVFATGVTDYLPKSTLPQFSEILSRHANDLCIVSFPKYDVMSLLRWFWIGLVKRVSLSYYTFGEIERLARPHAFEASDVEAYPLYYVVGLSRTRPGR